MVGCCGLNTCVDTARFVCLVLALGLFSWKLDLHPPLVEEDDEETLFVNGIMHNNIVWVQSSTIKQ